MNLLISSSLSKDINKVVEYAESLNAGIEISRFGQVENLDDTIYESLDRHRKALENFSGLITLHALFLDINVIAQDTKIREISLRRFAQTFDFARGINAKTVVFHTGYNSMVKHPVYKKKFVQNYIQFWKENIKKYEEAGIIATLENTCEMSIDMLLEVIETVNSDNLKLCIDTGHININSKTDTCAWIEKGKKHLVHMHLHNNNGFIDEHKSLIEGTINFDKMFNTLEKLDLKPDLVVEIFNKRMTDESFEYLNKALGEKQCQTF